MVIKIIGLDKCIKKFGNIEGIDLMPEIREATYKVQGTAKDLAPVYPSPKANPRNIIPGRVGGRLMGSISTRFNKRGQFGMVFTNVEYAIYQEYGTRYQPGTPFMRPAMRIERAGINSSMKKYLREQLRKAVK